MGGKVKLKKKKNWVGDGFQKQMMLICIQVLQGISIKLLVINSKRWSTVHNGFAQGQWLHRNFMPFLENTHTWLTRRWWETQETQDFSFSKSHDLLSNVTLLPKMSSQACEPPKPVTITTIFSFFFYFILAYSWFTVLYRAKWWSYTYPGLLHCRQILYHLSYQGSPYTYTNIYSLFFRLFSHVGYYRILSIIPCAIL